MARPSGRAPSSSSPPPAVTAAYASPPDSSASDHLGAATPAARRQRLLDEGPAVVAHPTEPADRIAGRGEALAVRPFGPSGCLHDIQSAPDPARTAFSKHSANAQILAP